MEENNGQMEVCPVGLYDTFVNATTFRGILHSFGQICCAFDLDPIGDQVGFYPRLKESLTTWKAAKLWALLDKRLGHKEYKKQRACGGLKVLVIGAGPCGLRMAIECALLGAKVVLVEKRDRFSRNNVLHVWPFVIADLKALGAKLFFPKFCAGSLDHVCIRQLQCLLLKVALVLGVEVHENVSFEELLEPMVEAGWSARFAPESHHVNDYEFNVLIGADGKRNTVPGFRRKEFRGKLAIGITANFINRHTQAEQRVPEISGVAFIFNQQFFKDLKEKTGVDLENIVYYKDETHYFVMCAKKQSLLDRKVIKNDSDDVSVLLSADNVDQKALLSYAMDAADFSTEGALPHLDYARNHFGMPDVAMFDFTSLFSAEYSCRLVEKRGRRLLMSIVGDSLHEPFWPTGSGCARGFLGVFDTAWMLKSYCAGRLSPLEVIAERELIYRLLAQTTPETLQKNVQKYSIDPRSRYPSLESNAAQHVHQVRHLYESDGVPFIDWFGPSLWADPNAPLPVAQDFDFSVKRSRPSLVPTGTPDKSLSRYVEQGRIIRWCQLVVQPYRLRVDNLTVALHSGLVIGAVISRFRPNLIDYSQLDHKDAEGNWERILDVCQHDLNLKCCPSDANLLNDDTAMVPFITEIYETFRENKVTLTALPQSSSNTLTGSRVAQSPTSSELNSYSNQLASAIQTKRKLSTDDSSFRSDVGHFDDVELSWRSESDAEREERFHKRLEDVDTTFQTEKRPAQSLNDLKQIDKISADRLKQVERLIEEQLPIRIRDVKKKKQPVNVTKGDINHMEDSTRGKIWFNDKLEKVKEDSFSSQDHKMIAAKTSSIREKAETQFREDPSRFGDFDDKLKDLSGRLKNSHLTGTLGIGNLREAHERSIEVITPVKLLPKEILSRSPSRPMSFPPESQSSSCYFCDSRVYLAEKMCVEGTVMHKRCFKCEFCNMALRLGNYVYDGTTYPLSPTGKGRFFCVTHSTLSAADKLSKLSPCKAPVTPVKTTPPPVPAKRTSLTASTPEPTAPPAVAAKTNVVVSPPTYSAPPPVALSPIFSGSVASLNTPERAEFEYSLPRSTTVSKDNLNDSEAAQIADETDELDEDLVNKYNSGVSEEGNVSDDGEEGPTQVGMGESDFDESDVELSDREQAELEASLSRGESLFSSDTLARLAGRLKRRRSVENLVGAGRAELSTTEGETSEEENAEESESDDQKSPGPPKLSRIESEFKAPLGLPPRPTAKKPDRLELDSTAPQPHQQSPLRQSKIAELEMLKSQLREKARQKSDAELGMSPSRTLTKIRRASISGGLPYLATPTDKPGEIHRQVELRRSAPSSIESSLKRSVVYTPSGEDPTEFSPSVYHSAQSHFTGGSTDSPHNVASPADEQPFHVVMREKTAAVSTPASSDSPTSSPEKVAKRKSFIQRLFHLDGSADGTSSAGAQKSDDFVFVPASGSVQSDLSAAATSIASPSPTSPEISLPVSVACESSREQSLLSKIGRKVKHRRSKETSPPILTPPNKKLSPKKITMEVVDGAAALKSKRKVDELLVAPKAADYRRLYILDEILSSEDHELILMTTGDDYESIDASPENLTKLNGISSSTSNLSVDSNVSERDIKRAERVMTWLEQQQQMKRHRQAQEIQRALQELDVRIKENVHKGVVHECILEMDPHNRRLLEEWILLVNEKSSLTRAEGDLNIRMKELALEQEHGRLQQQLRDKMSVAPEEKSRDDLHAEAKILERMLTVVAERDSLVTQLEENRQQEIATEAFIEAALSKKDFNWYNFAPVFLPQTLNTEITHL